MTSEALNKGIALSCINTLAHALHRVYSLTLRSILRYMFSGTFEEFGSRYSTSLENYTEKMLGKIKIFLR